MTTKSKSKKGSTIDRAEGPVETVKPLVLPPEGAVTITRSELVRLAAVNSKNLPGLAVIDGKVKRWVGIGWVDEGRQPTKDHVWMVEDGYKPPKAGKKPKERAPGVLNKPSDPLYGTVETIKKLKPGIYELTTPVASIDGSGRRSQNAWPKGTRFAVVARSYAHHDKTMPNYHLCAVKSGQSYSLNRYKDLCQSDFVGDRRIAAKLELLVGALEEVPKKSWGYRDSWRLHELEGTSHVSFLEELWERGRISDVDIAQFAHDLHRSDD